MADLPDGEMWLMAPVLAGLCSYRDLLDPSLTLEDFALMNDALSVKAENQRRAREYQDRSNPHGN
jgi:hypothetical protein